MLVAMYSTVMFFRLIPEYLTTDYDVNLQQRFLLLFYIYIILGLLAQGKNIDEENLKTGSEIQYLGSRRESLLVLKRGKVSFRTGLLSKHFIYDYWW
jgi:hypothetical protein